MKAVIKVGSTQYIVEPGQELILDHISSEAKTLVFDEVLLVQDGDVVKVGQPTVSGAKVEAELIGQTKGPKVRVAKFKAKSRYRKHVGFRSKLSKVKIISVKM
jgi:large subunit ribosomal protein L21